MPREKKPKKEKEPRRRKLKVVDFATLPDAIVDGKFVVKLKGRVLFERAMWDIHKIEIHRGVVMNVRDGDITLYDDTMQQWYSFDTHTPPLIKADHVEDLLDGTVPVYNVLVSKIQLPTERTMGAGDVGVTQVGTPLEESACPALLGYDGSIEGETLPEPESEPATDLEALMPEETIVVSPTEEECHEKVSIV